MSLWLTGSYILNLWNSVQELFKMKIVSVTIFEIPAIVNRSLIVFSHHFLFPLCMLLMKRFDYMFVVMNRKLPTRSAAGWYGGLGWKYAGWPHVTRAGQGRHTHERRPGYGAATHEGDRRPRKRRCVLTVFYVD